MALPEKGSHQISVDGQLYRWAVSRVRGSRTVYVHLLEEPGQRLEVVFLGRRPGEADVQAVSRHVPRNITRGLVEGLILWGLARGWQPGRRGLPPFRIEDAREKAPIAGSFYTDGQHYRWVRWPGAGRSTLVLELAGAPGQRLEAVLPEDSCPRRRPRSGDPGVDHRWLIGWATRQGWLPARSERPPFRIENVAELEWRFSTDPNRLLALAPGLSERKARLLASACALCIPDDGENNDLDRAALLASALFADRRLTAGQLASVRKLALVRPGSEPYSRLLRRHCVERLTTDEPCRPPDVIHPISTHLRREGVDLRSLCGLVRCVAGPPFPPAPRLSADVLAWRDGTVRRIAEAIDHQESGRCMSLLAACPPGDATDPDAGLRRLEELAARVLAAARADEARLREMMPILGDALEDAGCTDERVLAHCREDAPHARGCWVLDIVVGEN